MIVYKIVTHEYAGSLKASGRPARWNSAGNNMIYTAGSVSLACLENIVHRSGEGLSGLFKILHIEIPGKLTHEEISPAHLQENWTAYTNVHITRIFGDNWLKSMASVVLCVPSAIIPQESNYLINPAHMDFKIIRIVKTEDFSFDNRIK
jgi:RES domain-containing protein